MFLSLYNTVSPRVRAELGERLFQAWIHPTADEQAECDARFKAASKRFKTGPLRVSVFGEMRLERPADEGGGA
jgi:hypothetical protein